MLTLLRVPPLPVYGQQSCRFTALPSLCWRFPAALCAYEKAWCADFSIRLLYRDSHKSAPSRWGRDLPRGSDFEARWTEGAWAELKLLEALNDVPELIAVQFGITDGTAFWSQADMDARNLPEQGRHGKRPDILVFRRSSLKKSEVGEVGKLGLQSDAEAEELARRAVMAIESEFSPYAYKHRLEHYEKELSFTIKDEDLKPLVKWHKYFDVPLGIAQVYFDSAYFLSFGLLLDGIKSGAIKRQIERAYKKPVYYPKMSLGVPFGDFVENPAMGADNILDKYGKYTPVRKVTGGKLKISDDMRAVLTGKK